MNPELPLEQEGVQQDQTAVFPQDIPLAELTPDTWHEGSSGIDMTATDLVADDDETGADVSLEPVSGTVAARQSDNRDRVVARIEEKPEVPVIATESEAEPTDVRLAAGDVAVAAATRPERRFDETEIRQALYSYLGRVGATKQPLTLTARQARATRLFQDTELTMSDIADQLGSTEDMLDAAHEVIAACRTLLPVEQHAYSPKSAVDEANAIRQDNELTYAALEERTGHNRMLLEAVLTGQPLLAPEEFRRVVRAMGSPAGEVEMVVAQYERDHAAWQMQRQPAAHQDIELLRLERGINRRRLSGEAGINVHSLTVLLNGEGYPPREKVESVLTVLGANDEQKATIMRRYDLEKAVWDAEPAVEQEPAIVFGQGQLPNAVRFLHGKLGDREAALGELSDRQRKALDLILDDRETPASIREKLGGRVNASRAARELVDVLTDIVGSEGLEQFTISAAAAKRQGIGPQVDILRQASGISRADLAREAEVLPHALLELLEGRSHSSESLVLERALAQLGEDPDAIEQAVEQYEAEKFAATGKYSNTGVVAEISVRRQLLGVEHERMAAELGLSRDTLQRFFGGRGGAGLVHPDIIDDMLSYLQFRPTVAAALSTNYRAEVDAVYQEWKRPHAFGQEIRGMILQLPEPRPTPAQLQRELDIPETNYGRLMNGAVYIAEEQVERLLRRLNLPEPQITQFMEQYRAGRDAREAARMKYRGVEQSLRVRRPRNT